MFQTLQAHQSPLQTVQGLLLLCLWPLPVKHLLKDMVHTTSGIAMQLALHIGLHVAGIGQDFARIPLQSHAAEQAYRAELWRHCIITCQRLVSI